MLYSLEVRGEREYVFGPLLGIREITQTDLHLQLTSLRKG